MHALSTTTIATGGLPVSNGTPSVHDAAVEEAADLRVKIRKRRGRVYLACQQCRARKIKCDGSKPVCMTCSLRNHHSRCHYDERLKRRGPDRAPRVRLSHTKAQQRKHADGASGHSSDSASIGGGIMEVTEEWSNLGTSSPKGEESLVGVMNQMKPSMPLDVWMNRGLVAGSTSGISSPSGAATFRQQTSYRDSSSPPQRNLSSVSSRLDFEPSQGLSSAPSARSSHPSSPLGTLPSNNQPHSHSIGAPSSYISAPEIDMTPPSGTPVLTLEQGLGNGRMPEVSSPLVPVSNDSIQFDALPHDYTTVELPVMNRMDKMDLTNRSTSTTWLSRDVRNGPTGTADIIITHEQDGSAGGGYLAAVAAGIRGSLSSHTPSSPDASSMTSESPPSPDSTSSRFPVSRRQDVSECYIRGAREKKGCVGFIDREQPVVVGENRVVTHGPPLNELESDAGRNCPHRRFRIAAKTLGVPEVCQQKEARQSSLLYHDSHHQRVPDARAGTLQEDVNLAPNSRPFASIDHPRVSALISTLTNDTTQMPIRRTFDIPAALNEGDAFAEENPIVEMYSDNTYPGGLSPLPLSRNPFSYGHRYAPLSKSGFCRAWSSPSGETGRRSEGFHNNEIISSPSVEFTRQVWWAALCKRYNPNPEVARRMIMQDVHHLFAVSNFFISFINVPRFLSMFSHSDEREEIQPALVFSILALSTFLKSNDLELGGPGRVQALRLRDEAQAHMEASLNAGWLSLGLAQAALILYTFEVSCHPQYSDVRADSALAILDGFIGTLGLLSIDAANPACTTFRRNEVPTIAPVTDCSASVVHLGHPTASWTRDHTRTARAHMRESPADRYIDRCSCMPFKVGSTTPSSRKMTPFWLGTPGWRIDWSDKDVKLEESRRLVWSALTVGTARLSYSASIGERPVELGITKPWKFNVLFPGETLFGDSPPEALAGSDGCKLGSKNSVWSLYARSQLLYASSLYVEWNKEMKENEKNEFAMRAWLETENIEATLNSHSCDIEKTSMYHGREFLFNTQILVSSHWSRKVPHPFLGDPHFNREKALGWLRRQMLVSKHLLGNLRVVTGLNDHILARRPQYIFWFHSQIARCLTVWERDPTLIIALDLSNLVVPAIEYLLSIFPSSYQRKRYLELHARLVNACHAASLEAPAPPDFKIKPSIFL